MKGSDAKKHRPSELKSEYTPKKLCNNYVITDVIM